MSKVILVTDFHFGIHSDSELFLDYQKRFFKEQFFPYLEANKITEIISLGDEFHSRKAINYNTLHFAKEMFFDVISENNYRLKIIIGNHNVFHKFNNEVNSARLLFESNTNIQVIEEPTEIVYDNIKFLLVPWINKNNEHYILKSITETTASYLLGHFEVSDIKLHNNWEFSEGLDHSIIDKFYQVWSGHYHHSIEKDNFKYLGTCWHLNWDDVNYTKGFHVFDTETKELIFIENTIKMYNIIEYKDSIIDIDNFNYNLYIKSYVRVILNETIVGYTKFDMFIRKLEAVCYNVEVDERFYDVVSNSISDTKNETTDDSGSTLDSISSACDDIEFVDNKALLDYMKGIYIKAKGLMTT